MKKTIRNIAAVALAVFAGTLAIAAEDRKAIIKDGRNAVVRQGPALDAPMVFQLAPGSMVARTDKVENGFVFIKAEGGREGWTYKNNLSTAPAAATPTAALVTPVAAPQAPGQVASVQAGSAPAVAAPAGSPPAASSSAAEPVAPVPAAAQAPVPPTPTEDPTALSSKFAVSSMLMIAAGVLLALLIGILGGMTIERRRIRAAYTLFEKIEN